MSCDWEGNRRYDVALAMRHRLKWFMYLRVQGLNKGDKHPTNTLHAVWYSLLLPEYIWTRISDDILRLLIVNTVVQRAHMLRCWDAWATFFCDDERVTR